MADQPDIEITLVRDGQERSYVIYYFPWKVSPWRISISYFNPLCAVAIPFLIFKSKNRSNQQDYN